MGRKRKGSGKGIRTFGLDKLIEMDRLERLRTRGLLGLNEMVQLERLKKWAMREGLIRRTAKSYRTRDEE